MKNPFTDLSNYKIIKEPEYTSEAETETTTKPRLVMGIETPLDTISITLQNKRESNQEDSSKQTASVTPPLVKQLQSQWQQRIQEFKNQIRMPPVGTESVQSAPPRGTESVQSAPPRGIESMQSASPHTTDSQQTLYLKEILTRELGEE